MSNEKKRIYINRIINSIEKTSKKIYQIMAMLESVFRNGNLCSGAVMTVVSGVRPVITVSKSNLN